MKTLKHKLLSIPGKEIEISEKYAKIADNLINDLKAVKIQDDVNPTLNVYGYIWDAKMHDITAGILEASEDSSYYKRSIDKLYIKLGQEALDRDSALSADELKEQYQKKKQRLMSGNGIKYAKLNTALNIIENESKEEWKRAAEKK